MRRFLLALLMMFGVASVQAISISWQVANSEYNWDNTASSYLVYAQSGDLTAEAVREKTFSNAYIIDDEGVKYADGEGQKVTNAGGFYVASDFGETKDTKAVIDVNIAENVLTPGGYFYLVVFNTSSNDEYAVSRAVQYTGTANDDTSNGIYDILVDGSTPDAMDYIEIPWLGGTWREAVVPEPTALALLALGVAGLALRRKI